MTRITDDEGGNVVLKGTFIVNGTELWMNASVDPLTGNPVARVGHVTDPKGNDAIDVPLTEERDYR